MTPLIVFVRRRLARLAAVLAGGALLACDARPFAPKPRAAPCNYHPGDTLRINPDSGRVRIRFCP